MFESRLEEETDPESIQYKNFGKLIELNSDLVKLKTELVTKIPIEHPPIKRKRRGELCVSVHPMGVTI